MNRVRKASVCVLLFVAAALPGCGAQEHKPASSLTQAQRDTAIAKSDLPGAVVQRALDVNGVAAQRSAGMDSTAK